MGQWGGGSDPHILPLAAPLGVSETLPPPFVPIFTKILTIQIFTRLLYRRNFLLRPLMATPLMLCNRPLSNLFLHWIINHILQTFRSIAYEIKQTISENCVNLTLFQNWFLYVIQRISHKSGCLWMTPINYTSPQRYCMWSVPTQRTNSLLQLV